MNQLSIFDVINQFDENRANWENILDQFETCNVTAIIPKDALSPLEQGYSYGRVNSKKERSHKLWQEYATAIWSYLTDVEKIKHGEAWNKACDRLEEYRDSEKPCPMEVVRWLYKNNDFKPENVVEYLWKEVIP